MKLLPLARFLPKPKGAGGVMKRGGRGGGMVLIQLVAFGSSLPQVVVVDEEEEEEVSGEEVGEGLEVEEEVALEDGEEVACPFINMY